MHRRSFLSALTALALAPVAFCRAKVSAVASRPIWRNRGGSTTITFDGAPLVPNRYVPTDKMYYVNASRFHPQWFEEDEKH